MRSFPGLVIVLRARHRNFGANPSGQSEQQGLRLGIGVTHYRSRPLQIFLQLERVALDREVQIADRKSGNDVADSAARQI